MGAAALVAVVAAGLWLGAAAVSAHLPPRPRGWAAWALVLTGVPLLGCLTLYWGPTAGLALFGAGILLLIRLSPRARPVRRQQAGRMAAPRSSAPLTSPLSGPFAAAGDPGNGQMP
ncbi:DUF2484 family protein [uncultured Paracoccus sp.]|uniref:DUF2484 family protein n=1 Tax=uncultured Paracoccus sp. TaxID=189685 RepID=UPI00261EA371|nr:DUF2484 family protein [uncultured Paracoccus sp.]